MTPPTRTEGNRGAAARSNFYYSFLFLPQAKREAIHRVYAFCRAVDDVADGALPDRDKKSLIEEWRKELDRCYAGRPTHPITQALLPSIRTFHLTRDHFEELINGVEMDLTTTRYETFNELSRYCYRVAGTVGLLCLEIFEALADRYRDYAIHLGTAVQLTNILRDLKSDAERGIIYLPQEDLRRFGYSEEELRSSTYNDRFIRLMQYECQRAHELYRKADSLLKPEDRRRVFASLIMAKIYRSLLQRIESSRYNVFSEKAALSAPFKFLVAFRTWLLA
jgi:phytoene synthase